MKRLVTVAFILLISTAAAIVAPSNGAGGGIGGNRYPIRVVNDENDNKVIERFFKFNLKKRNEYLYLIYQASLVEPRFLFWREIVEPK